MYSLTKAGSSFSPVISVLPNYQRILNATLEGFAPPAGESGEPGATAVDFFNQLPGEPANGRQNRNCKPLEMWRDLGRELRAPVEQLPQ